MYTAINQTNEFKFDITNAMMVPLRKEEDRGEHTAADSNPTKLSEISLATQSAMMDPVGVAFDSSSGDLFIAEAGSNIIRQVCASEYRISR